MRAPFELTLYPRYVDQSDEDVAGMRQLLDEIDKTHPPVLIDHGITSCEYGVWAVNAIDPDSALGQVLIRDWHSVPALIDELRNDTQTPRERAHTLANLYSITGLVSPLPPPHAENNYRDGEIGCAIGPYAEVNNFRLTEDDPLIKLRGFGAISTDTYYPPVKLVIDEREQDRCSQQWIRYSGFIEVVPPQMHGGFGASDVPSGKGFF